MVLQMFPAGHQRAPLPPSQEAAAHSESPAPTELTAQRSAPSQPRRSGARDPFLDNAKFLTIVLVVCGHSWGPLRGESRAAETLYMVVYTFHMPAFIIISGYLSRSFEARPGQLKRLLTGVALPYLIFETVFTLFKRYLDGSDEPFSLTRPSYALWFLIALFIWRLTAPVWKLLRWPMPVALVIAALASATPDISTDLNLQRVFQFLPFFVLGLQLKPEHFKAVQRRSLRLLAVPVLLAAVVVGYWASPRMNVSWFYHVKAAQNMGAPGWVGIVMMLALFACGLALTVCFLAWVPTRRTWFTSLGAGTMYAYLLHVYPHNWAIAHGWYKTDWINTPGGRVFVTLCALTVATALCSPPVRRLFRPLVEPRVEWMFRRDAGAQARKREQDSRGTRDPQHQQDAEAPGARRERAESAATH